MHVFEKYDVFFETSLNPCQPSWFAVVCEASKRQKLYVCMDSVQNTRLNCKRLFGSFSRNPSVLLCFGRGPGVAGRPGGAGLWSRWPAGSLFSRVGCLFSRVACCFLEWLCLFSRVAL
jgi:hypothetical protein